jgi:hypothetical protein
MRDESQGGGGPDQSGEALVWIVARTLSASVVVFLRKDFGKHFLGIPGVIALIVIPLFAGVFRGHDLRPMLYFWEAYFAMCVAHRIGGLRRAWKGVHLHSQYSGTPRLCRLFPTIPESIIKRCIEPALIVLAGLLATSWNEPLGSYLVWAGIALAIAENLTGISERRRMTDMLDGYLDQSYRARQFGHARSGRAF